MDKQNTTNNSIEIRFDHINKKMKVIDLNNTRTLTISISDNKTVLTKHLMNNEINLLLKLAETYYSNLHLSDSDSLPLN